MTGRKPGQGQTALVTGASAGIGVDLAECFARDGYDLILTARSEAALAQVANRLAKTHEVRTHAIAQDLGAIGGGARLAEQIAARGLDIDVVVNNAGYGHAGALTSSDLPTQLGMIDLNVRALVELTYLYWDGMLGKRRGGVLNVASTAAFQPGPLMANYYASKAYVLSFSEALWEEARGTGVHVSCLCPGPTVSKFRERAGTGKTKLIALLIAAWERAIAPGHREALQRGLGDRLGLDYLGDTDRFRGQKLGKDGRPTLRLSLCWDSLLAINLAEYPPGSYVLVLDEADQGLRHLILGGTCAKDGKRPALIARAIELIKNAGLVILASADLTAIELDFIASIRNEEPWILRNDYQSGAYICDFATGVPGVPGVPGEAARACALTSRPSSALNSALPAPSSIISASSTP